MGFFDDDYEVTPTGIYAAKLENCTLDETKADPKISVTYKLHSGKVVWQNFTFKETTKKWLAWQLGVIGAWGIARDTCTDAENQSSVARACLDAIGKKIGSYYEGEITHREYNGKTYTDFKLDREMTAQEAKAFTASVKTESKMPPPPTDVHYTQKDPW